MAMSPEHKAALVQGRKEAKAIKTYLDALGSRKPGRPVTKSSVEKRLASIDTRLKDESDALKRLDLHQSRIEAEGALSGLSDTIDLTELENEFAQVVRGYADRKGISYGAWRNVGVSAATLKKAGIPRTRRG